MSTPTGPYKVVRIPESTKKARTAAQKAALQAKKAALERGATDQAAADAAKLAAQQAYENEMNSGFMGLTTSTWLAIIGVSVVGYFVLRKPKRGKSKKGRRALR